eukprot:UN06688
MRCMTIICYRKVVKP